MTDINKTKKLVNKGISILRELREKVCKEREDCKNCPFFERSNAIWGNCEFNIIQSLKNYNNGLTKIEPLTEEKIKEVIDFHKEAQGLI